MKLVRFIVALSICFIIAGLGSLVTYPSIPTWYANLIKPFFTPPSFVFGPVWTILYIMMGTALYIVWDKKTKKRKLKKLAVKVFLLQLVLNFLWSYVFFYLNMLWMSVLVIVFLWVSIFICIKLFSKISKTASYLLYPYIVWVSFATLLNIAISVLN
ncbi:MAG: tryptophan-rich sensory protein [Candidatus Levybacteria bacterium]|nr:tryptophan-rich sensory protein [Candidatus Levybacteria bacterium]MBP9815092.1 tryptophan-rich sensory protein [Candidatus Levybacteria bacterium]